MEKKLYDLMDWAAIEETVYAEAPRPDRLLGENAAGTGQLVFAFFPGAKNVKIITKKGKVFQMEEADEAGVFTALLPYRKPVSYEYEAEYENGDSRKVKDPYLYRNLLEPDEVSKFLSGESFDAWNFLGAHTGYVTGILDDASFTSTMELGNSKASIRGKEKEKEKVKGTFFAVWAPHAMRVSVVGDFNGWDPRTHQMIKDENSGIFFLFIPDVGEGELYKYSIKRNPRLEFLKSDPFARRSELRPADASIVPDDSRFTWKDSEWISERKNRDIQKSPVNIYEMHLGSWKRKDDSFMNYREIGEELSPYLEQQEYNCVEILPLMEHPLDESLGYQASGYFSATSRYGTPEDLKKMTDSLHRSGKGVILDWVPASFAKNASGLSKFDGDSLYEYSDPQRGLDPQWGTCIFDMGRPEVRSFLLSSAFYWLSEFHADGIKINSLENMLYLDNGRDPGEWQPNIYGGNENLQSESFVKTLTAGIHKRLPGTLIIAEETRGWPKLTASVEEGGLGVDFKWNSTWRNDFLDYMRTDPLFRKGRHGILTFSLLYAYSEHYILPFSHGEFTDMKGSLLGKMPGDFSEKIGNFKAAFGFLMLHPGKKLCFMGTEAAIEEEWDVTSELNWSEINDDVHSEILHYTAALNRFYMDHPALYDNDSDESGFEWVSSMDSDHSIITFARKSRDGRDRLFVVINFTPVVYENFICGVPEPGTYREVFNSDAVEFGGTGHINREPLESSDAPWDGREQSISIQASPLAVSIFTY